MPRVSQQYLEEKKNMIMDATLELVKEIPLYKLTMSDIIRKLECSQGMIYRYFQGVDEIYVCLMNREIQDIELKKHIDEIIESDRTDKDKLDALFQELGSYTLEVLNRIGGKFLYELQVRYVFDMEKKELWLPQLLIKQNFMYFQQKCVEYVVMRVQQGVFHLRVPIEDLVLYAGVNIDGILYYAETEADGDNSKIAEQIFTLSKMLAQYIYENVSSKEE